MKLGRERARGRENDARDRGAAAVEFALVVPVLFLMLFGIIDFGRLYNAQVTITQAAREGARLAALGTATAAVQTRTESAATGLNSGDLDITVTSCASTAGPTADARVLASFTFRFVTPIGSMVESLANPITLTATGVMPCET